MIMSLSDNFLSEKSEVFYNTRTKYYEDENGALVPFEIACANRQIFKESGAVGTMCRLPKAENIISTARVGEHVGKYSIISYAIILIVLSL